MFRIWRTLLPVCLVLIILTENTYSKTDEEEVSTVASESTGSTKAKSKTNGTTSENEGSETTAQPSNETVSTETIRNGTKLIDKISNVFMDIMNVNNETQSNSTEEVYSSNSTGKVTPSSLTTLSILSSAGCPKGIKKLIQKLPEVSAWLQKLYNYLSEDLD